MTRLREIDMLRNAGISTAQHPLLLMRMITKLDDLFKKRAQPVR
jgi:hypothetical protein